METHRSNGALSTARRGFENRDPLKGDGNTISQSRTWSTTSRDFENRDPLKGDGNALVPPFLGSMQDAFENRDPLKGDGNSRVRPAWPDGP